MSFYLFYVATILCVLPGIVMLRHRHLCRDSISVQVLQMVLRPSFFVATAFLFGFYCNNVSYIISISIAARKIFRYRVLSPLNLISCYSFILILRHSLLVLSMFVIRDPVFMSRQDFSVFSLSLCRNPVCYIMIGPFFLVLESFY